MSNCVGQLVDSERLITQFPLSRNKAEGRIYSAIVEWIHPSINGLSGLMDTGHTDATQERPGPLSDGINLETNRQRLGESSQGEGGSQDPNIRWKIEEAEAEYAAVEAQYKGMPQWMKAPNGKPTKLTERQWVQVRTPSFKRWFGDWEALAIIKAVNDAVTQITEGVDEIVTNGRIDRYSAVRKTVNLALGNARAVLSLDEHGKQKTWLLTGWEEGSPDVTSKFSAKSGTTQLAPTFSRSQLGAGLSEIFIASNAAVNPEAVSKVVGENGEPMPV